MKRKKLDLKELNVEGLLLNSADTAYELCLVSKNTCEEIKEDILEKQIPDIKIEYPDGAPLNLDDFACEYTINNVNYRYTEKQINEHIRKVGVFCPYLPLVVIPAYDRRKLETK